MSYVRLNDLGQVPTAPAAPAPTTGAQSSDFSTGQMVTGIIGAVLSAGATIGTKLIEVDTQKKIAKEQAKADERQAMIQQQFAQQQAALMASMQPVSAPVDTTKIALLAGGGLAAVVLIAVLARGGKKEKKKDRDTGPSPWQQWGPPPSPWGPPPGYGQPPAPPPGFAPPPPMARNRRKSRKAA